MTQLPPASLSPGASAPALPECLLQVGPLEFQPLTAVPNGKSLIAWLQRVAADTGPGYLLAHCDDGVVWGRFDHKAGTLIHSGGIELLPQRLQQARLFSPAAELLLWRGEKDGNAGWYGRLIRDTASSDSGARSDAERRVSHYDEMQILWGTRGAPAGHGFTWLGEGHGLWHCLPIAVPSTAFSEDGKHRPARLIVRHFVEPDDDGIARVTLSRLVDLAMETSAEVWGRLRQEQANTPASESEARHAESHR